MNEVIYDAYQTFSKLGSPVPFLPAVLKFITEQLSHSDISFILLSSLLKDTHTKLSILVSCTQTPKFLSIVIEL